MNENVTGWRKSSRSGKTNCVEVGRTDQGRAAVRDTKDLARGFFTADTTQWSNFINAVKSDRFNT